jgi:hypothetical protein
MSMASSLVILFPIFRSMTNWALFPNRMQTSAFGIDKGDLIVKGPEIIEISEAHQTRGQEVNDSGDPLPHVHPMDAEQPQEREQDPRDGIVDGACPKS